MTFDEYKLTVHKPNFESLDDACFSKMVTETEKIIEKIIIERNKEVDSALLCTIRRIATENGFETRYILSENAVIKVFEKNNPKRAIHDEPNWVICPSCGGSVCLENVLEHIHNNENTYCEHCGQALDWSGDK